MCDERADARMRGGGDSVVMYRTLTERDTCGLPKRRVSKQMRCFFLFSRLDSMTSCCFALFLFCFAWLAFLFLLRLSLATRLASDPRILNFEWRGKGDHALRPGAWVRGCVCLDA